MKWRNLKFFKNVGDHYAKCTLVYADKNKTVFPPYEDHLKAFDLTPFEEVKAVILGQDPYPKKGHAHGLAFSVMPHIKPLPRSLCNILKEYQSDLGMPLPKTGCLNDWAANGVLLLNTILTVEEGKPLSHQGIGWEKLTYEVLRKLSLKGDGVVFMLWGKKAQEYKGLIDPLRHCVLCAPHPSPRSTGFLGCKHFSLANKYREERGMDPINWKLR